MKFFKICLTGGPCGGKTTGLSYIEREFTKMGYKVVIINESATEIILSGLHNHAYNDNYTFEQNILKLQKVKEDLYTNACLNLPNEKVLLICDRGLMDCKCYMSHEEFNKYLQESSAGEVELRDNYDAVFHLLTAAKGAEQFYTTANNEARYESVELARINDDKTISAWTGHPHFRIIDNSTTFEGKMKRLIKEICAVLGEPIPMEIERKFLIKMPDIEQLKSMPNCESLNIVQTYLLSKPNEETRVRQRGKNGSYIYTLTTKKIVSDSERFEFERRISEREYLEFLNHADTNLHQIRKTRYCLVENNKYFEIDVYPFAKNTAICEIELLDKNENFTIPNYIQVIKEVTNDKKFSNYAFAKNIPHEMN